MKSSTLIFCVASFLTFGCAPHRSSTTQTRTYTLPSWGDGAPRLQIDLPSSFSVKRHEGPDFEVFYFSDASTKSSMGLYVGHNPDFQHIKAGITDVRRQQGRVGEVSVEWIHWSSNDRQHSEAFVDDFFGHRTPKKHGGLTLHIFAGAPTEQGVARMEAATATLRLERAR